MRRLFWAGLGATVAVVAVQKLRSTARRYTPEGVQEQVEEVRARTGSAFRGAIETFQDARRRRAEELTAALFVTPEEGDPHAVLGRRGSRAVDVPDGVTSGHGGAAGAGGRGPSGRVDPDEPLYDF